MKAKRKSPPAPTVGLGKRDNATLFSSTPEYTSVGGFSQKNEGIAGGAAPPQSGRANSPKLPTYLDYTIKPSEPISRLLDQAIERVEFYQGEAARHLAAYYAATNRSIEHQTVKRALEARIFGGGL